jgi:hypothetical protein
MPASQLAAGSVDIAAKSPAHGIVYAILLEDIRKRPYLPLFACLETALRKIIQQNQVDMASRVL